MKKNCLMLVCLVLFMALNATAQVASVADLFGKYRFTADVEFTQEGQAYKDVLSGDCDAIIEEDGTYIAKIVGFAGSQVQQNINAISTEKNMLKVINLNNPALWSNGLMLANENGDNPYGVWNSETSNWDVESYGPVYYTYDPATKEISIPAFTVITMSDYTAAKGTVIAKYTNVKMVLVESETIEVADISGDWNFAAGSGTYDTMEGSVIPKDFSVALVKNGDSNRAYTATIVIEGYDNIEMPATFDGNILALAYDDTYLDKANGIRFAPMYGSAKNGTIEFMSQSETAFTLYNGFSFASDMMGKTQDETADSLIVNGEYHQWYIAGTLKSAAGGSQTFAWDGTWNVKVASASDVIVADGGASGVEWPAEFQMNVAYDEASGAYYVENFMDFDIRNLNQGGLLFTPDADGAGASITLDGGSYQVALLKSNGDGTFLQLTNQNGLKSPGIKLSRNEDGTFSVEPFFVQNLDFNTGAAKPVVFYNSSVAIKEAAEPEEPAFDWAGTYAFSGEPVSKDGSDYPASFYVTIEYFEATEYTDAAYCVTSFMGNDVYDMNYGGIELTIAEDGKSATLANGNVYSLGGGTFLKIFDATATANPVSITLNEDGTLSMADFTIVMGTWGNDVDNSVVAEYKNGVLVKGGEVTEPEEPAFDWAGTYAFSGEPVSKDGSDYPASFYVTIEYFEATEYTDAAYCVTSFMGNDVYDMNYGGIELTIAEDGKSATLANGNVYSLGGGTFLKIFDATATANPVSITLNEDGTLSMADFTIVKGAWGNDVDNTVVAEYKNGILVKGGEVTEPEEPVGSQYRIKCDAGYLNIGNTEDHPTGPVGGVNVVEYADDNNQIFTIEESGDGNVYLKSASGYYIYCHQWNVDGKESEKTALTFEEVGENKFYIKQAGGYFKVENVGGVNYPFCDAAISAAAVWSLEEVGSTGIENVKGEDAKSNGVYDLSGRKLEQISAPGLYIVNGKKMFVK